ncbi:unnamed protein product [Moneuplotes crassus]|uniref:Uncharacterized protein n=1 Tax=Euplotes crassus TaxID=5936 RepID=A0AAD1XAD9_EUPCR|nr:unnamed protein product [Moneuplotes crassus]
MSIYHLKILKTLSLKPANPNSDFKSFLLKIKFWNPFLSTNQIRINKLSNKLWNFYPFRILMVIFLAI